MTEEAREYTIAPPTEAEDLDLVALLNEGLTEEVFWLPTRDAEGQPAQSETFYVRAKRWTGREKARALGVGTTYEVSPDGKGKGTRGLVHTDGEVIARELVNTSVTDFLLPFGGKERRHRPGAAAWDVIGQQPAPFVDWLVKRLRAFQGLEEPASGEASPAASSAS